MNILLDECVPNAVGEFLKSKGFKIKTVSEVDSGAKNGVVYKIAIKDFSILITTDRHFKNILKFPATQTLGIIYVRVNPLVSSEIIGAINSFLAKGSFENVIGRTLILRRDNHAFVDETRKKH